MDEENDYRVLKEKMVQLRSSFKIDSTSDRNSRAPMEEHLQGEFNYLLGEIADLRSRLQEEKTKLREAEGKLSKARTKEADAHLMAEYNYLQEELSRIKHRERLRETEEDLTSGCGEITDVDDLKECIIQNVSHELRTPVTIASLAIEAAMKENDMERLKDYLVKADKALRRQERIIDDIMEVASSTSEQGMRVEEIRVRDVISAAVEELAQEARDKDIDVRAKIPEVTVWADFTKVRHALKNLLHNAVKFTDRGGTITISAKADKGMVEVSVQDSGIGIPEQFGEVIFDRLYQVDPSKTRKFGGTGMGLATAKGLIENHGGRLWFHSGVGGGSTFHFTLPTQEMKKADLKRRFRYPADTGLHTGS